MGNYWNNSPYIKKTPLKLGPIKSPDRMNCWLAWETKFTFRWWKSSRLEFLNTLNITIEIATNLYFKWNAPKIFRMLKDQKARWQNWKTSCFLFYRSVKSKWIRILLIFVISSDPRSSYSTNNLPVKVNQNSSIFILVQHIL